MVIDQQQTILAYFVQQLENELNSINIMALKGLNLGIQS